MIFSSSTGSVSELLVAERLDGFAQVSQRLLAAKKQKKSFDNLTPVTFQTIRLQS